ncbi:hypothetical protein FA15DRAFT_709690 [Coprinopsis marcescibilis]|uniref:Uncharacterized protein n=1 Tax=Coprinopsis marcescibilis TaxID=230819 RepID=A0A5C3KFN9_COPMA|nr:hypothetical protein FA15DRAFT_709690 [Coprinopsis marcescibilis]
MPTKDELVDVLTAIFTSNMFDQCFLFVDGLDEETLETWFDLLDTISKLPLNVLFTSRPLPLLKDSVPKARFFDIVVCDADNVCLIEEKVHSMKTLAKLLKMEGWREQVLKAMLKKSFGMFLVASLQLDMLGSCITIKDLRSALEHLPKGVHKIYTATMQCIENQPSPRMAKQALMTLVYTLESLYMDDLRHAITIDSKYNPDLLVDKETLLSICCGFIPLEPQSKLIHLVYFTAKDFLEPYLRKDNPKPHALIASSCIVRMMHCGLHDKQVSIPFGYHGSPFKENPFLGYSHCQWELHSHFCSSVPPDIVDFILQCCCFFVFDEYKKVLYIGSSVHVAAAFGFHTLLRKWFSQPQSSDPTIICKLDVNARTDNGWTPIHLASIFGYTETIRVLLDADRIDVCCTNNWGVTPLMRAS